MNRYPLWVTALACCLFGAAGLAFAPLVGIENDESLFGSALYAPAVAYSLHGIPLMLMSYVGALKGLLYWPVFAIWAPGPYSIRMPVVLVGIATVALFFLFLRRIAGEKVAAIGAVLLATDSIFFLTTVYDWGPVALQHLFLVGALWLGGRFAEDRRLTDLAGMFLLLGLGLWDKALFIWIIVGLALATGLVFWRNTWQLLTLQRFAVALGSFCCGAGPLLLFNLQHPLETLRANAVLAPEEIWPKFLFLGTQLHDGLFDWLVAPGSTSLWEPRQSLLGWAMLAALFFWKKHTRWMLFAALFMTAVFLQMAITKGAGASFHHTVLLWPFPQMLVALALGDSKPGRAAAIVLVCANLSVIGSYYSGLKRNGGTLIWSDAIYPLSRLDFKGEVYATDWGILENLTLLKQGKLAVQPGWALTNPDPQATYIGHTEGNEFFVGSRAKLLLRAEELSLRPEVLAVIRDARGKPIFEVFRLAH